MITASTQPSKTFSPVFFRGIFFAALLLSLTSLVQAKAARGQDALEKKVSVSLHDVLLKDALHRVAETAGVNIVFTGNAWFNTARVSLTAKEKPLRQVLSSLLAAYPLTYKAAGNNIIIRQRTEPPAPKNITRPAPEKQVQGQVTDEKGTPLPGVTVKLQDGNAGAVTDASGRYTLTVPDDNAVLSFSYIGYNPRTEVVGSRREINITLKESTGGLNEVVVVGYGTQKKSDLTVAVSTIAPTKLTQRHASNLTTALQGLAPGVTVWDKGGEPGGSNNAFNIRGVTTLNSSTPLMIVDGVEQSAYDLNPDDIASVSVLKDAASTAIYGSRAANGVILITTKRGKKGEVRVNYSGWMDFQNLSTVPKHIDTRSYLELQNLAYENRGSDPLYSDEDIQHYVSGDDRLKYPLPNDWFNQLIRKNAPWQNHSIDISGGGEKLTTFLSLRYMDQQGVFPNHDMQRYQLRMNNDIRIADNFSVNADLKVRRQNRNRTNMDQLYHWMIHGSQLAVPRYPDGTYGLSKQGNNPLAYADPNIVGGTKFTDDNAVINLQANWDIVKGLHFMTQYAFEINRVDTLMNTPTYEIRDYWNKDVVLKSNDVNQLKDGRQEDLQKTWNSTLSYDFLRDKHAVNLLAGYSEIAYRLTGLHAIGKKLYNNDLQDIEQSEPDSRLIGNKYADWGLRSVFGRVNYNYAERYILEFNMRYDGSSRFPPGNRYTFFPSVSGAWRISEEKFWDPLKDIADQVKIRGSWGKNGNQNINDLYTYFDRLKVANYYAFNDVPVTGVLQNELTVNDLHWEITTQTDIGLDLSFLQGKLNASFDWYKKLTSGILQELPIPGVIGLQPVATNAGKVQNTGWELQLNHQNDIGQLHYDVTVNFSDVKNKILDLSGAGPYFSQEKDRYIRMVGQPIDALWGYKTDGLITQEDLDKGYPLLYPDTKVGDIKYVDTNDDGKLTADDKTILGSTIPRWTYSANINLSWKNFDLNLFLQGVGQQNMMLWGAFIENGSWEGFMLDIGKDYWTPENTDARFPRPEKSSNRDTEPSSWWTLNASYLRLKNLQLGYTFPKTLTQKIRIHNLRVYVGGTNLLTFSGLKKWGMDAETPSGRDAIYPPLKTYTVGLNLGF
ncbi:TonB-dependent receptor [Compostibacter hankyongensis]|uniref:TonB-dependent receptor n=1 Tax=Compostibacter hankyongensis TaxID=1007089 RepID=A0ABP8FBN5_9BACT